MDRALPEKPGDFVVITCIIALACIPFILGNVILICNKNYRPIKTKNVNLTVLSSVGGLVWIGTTIVVNGHFKRPEKTLLAVCSLWSFWLQACFGFSLWLNCLNVHFIVLYYIFILKRPAGNVRFNATRLSGLLLPTVILCTCASFLHSSSFDKEHEDCKLKKLWSTWLILLFVFYFSIFVGLAFKLRSKAMAQYNEYRLIRRGGVISLFTFLLFLVTVQTHAYYEVVGRGFLSLSVSTAVFFYFWGRNGEVIYNVIFHKEEYLRLFNEYLRRRPSNRDSSTNFPTSFRDLESELEETMRLNTAYENRILNLEEEVQAMEQQLILLQQQREQYSGA